MHINAQINNAKSLSSRAKVSCGLSEKIAVAAAEPISCKMPTWVLRAVTVRAGNFCSCYYSGEYSVYIYILIRQKDKLQFPSDLLVYSTIISLFFVSDIFSQVCNLNSGYFYQFRVFAANMVGVGKPSEASKAFLCEKWTMPEPGKETKRKQFLRTILLTSVKIKK